MLKTLFVAALLTVVSASPLAAQAARGPSTESERTKAIGIIDDLEANPLGPNAKTEREWLLYWLIQVPDIHAGMCPALYPDQPKKDKQDNALIATQIMFSGSRYSILHPGSPAKAAEQYQMGIRGMLKMYEALIAQKPEDRQAGLDGLIKQREAGTLDDYIKTQALAHCQG